MGKNFVECSIDETYNAPVSTAESKKELARPVLMVSHSK